MKRLLQIEFIKLWNNKSSRVLILAYFLLLTSIALVAAIKFDIGPVKFHLAEQGIFNFPYIWHFNTFITAFFKLFLAIVTFWYFHISFIGELNRWAIQKGIHSVQIPYGYFICINFYTICIRGINDTWTYLFRLQ